jgi:hypothetical protein
MPQMTVGDFYDVINVKPVERPLAQRWFMLRVIPNRELKIEEKLSDRGVTVYLPKEQRSRRVGYSKYALRVVPIFEGAMFVPDYAADLRRLRDLAGGICGYHRFGERAISVTLEVLSEIRQFEREREDAKDKRRYKVGQRVRVKGGHLDMVLGKIASLDSHHRLTVLIPALGQLIPIAFDEDQVEAV